MEAAKIRCRAQKLAVCTQGERAGGGVPVPSRAVCSVIRAEPELSEVMVCFS